MSSKNPLSDTDRCVYCGLCLPHCPSYRVTRQEGDSPRGRIALMQGLDQGTLEVSDKLLGHLDRCLECQACEAMCPSEVPFTRLMDATRARVAPKRHRTRLQTQLQSLAYALLHNPGKLRAAGALLRLYQRSGMQWLTRRSGLLPARLRRWEQALPTLGRPLGAAIHGASPTARRVQLFTGCISALADTRTQRDSIRLLNALGYAVEIKEGQTCCGALLHHLGEAERAATLARINARIFAARDEDPLLVTASGCSAHLQQYTALYGDSPAGALGQRTEDITGFLAKQPWPEDLALHPLPARVALHSPCTLRHALRGDSAVATLLQHIPQLELLPLNPDGGCCGAAGSYFLTQAEMAQQIRAPLIERLQTMGVQTLVSANLGCALHLANGAREAGLALEIIHPVTLLARQLPDTEAP